MRVALCLTGLLRCYREAWPSINAVLAQPLRADIFVHTWSDIGYWVPGDSTVTRGFQETGITADAASLQAFYGAKAVVALLSR